VKFIRLRANNFLTIGDSGDIFLADRGLNLLQGENKDDPSASSNGAGKSTIPDALCWALYGTTARGASGDAVVSRKGKGGTVVTVDISEGDSIYTITRHRKHKTEKNALRFNVVDGVGRTFTDLTKGTEKETQAEIERFLGCPREVFTASIYAGQEGMPDLPAMTDKPLKMLIEEAAGIKRLEQAYEVARTEANALSVQRDTALGNVQRAEQGIHALNVEIESAKLRDQKFEEDRAKYIATLEESANTYRQGVVLGVAKLKEADVPALEARAVDILTQLSSISSVRAVADAYMRDTLTPAATQLASLQAALERAMKEAQAQRAVLDNAATELAKPCKECGKPHTPDELEAFKKHAFERLTDLVNKARAANEAVCVQQTMVTAAGVESRRLYAEVPDAGELARQQHETNVALMQAKDLRSRVEQGATQVRSIQKQIEQAKASKAPGQALIESCQEKIAKLREEHAKAVDTLSRAEADLAVAQSVVKVFGPAGVRAHILDTVTPFLNERTAEYLATLSDGNISAVWSTLTRNAKGELKEKFAIEVDNINGGGSFELQSGGEKRKVRLATMLALQDLVASRASKPIDLWCGDEVDDALDPAGLERLMTILERKARERGTVVIISHADLKDWVDDVTVVTKENGVSTVQGALTRA
jgi:DNA repair exonuclease SbcCD ATPase subunit